MALEGALSTKGPVTAEEVGTLASHRPVLAAGPLCVIQPVLDLPPVFGGGLLSFRQIFFLLLDGM